MRRARRSIICLALSMAATVGFTAPPLAERVAEAAPTELRDPTSRLLGPVTVIGDSVLLGGLLFSPTIVDALGAQGWGPIRARAGEGYRTGYTSGPTMAKASYWIDLWRAGGWDAPNVLVNLGSNDSGMCNVGDVGCAYRSIIFLVDHIGPGHDIWWPKITRHPEVRGYQDTWNAALDRVAAERSNVHTWDWPTVMYEIGHYEWDHTHMTAVGYRIRSQLMAEVFTAELARARRVGGDAPLPDPIGVPTEYVPLTPTRVVDTRVDPPGRLAARSTLRVDLTTYVPDGATAVAVNVTSARTDAAGFLSAHPCDRTRRDVSSVNHAAGVSRGAMAIVPLSADGQLCVHTESAGDVVVDLQGAFVPDGGARLTTVDADRLIDTRQSGRAALLEIEVPDPGVEAVTVNLTATSADGAGFLTADACDEVPPEVSNLNFLADEPVAGAAIVPVSDEGTICVRSSGSVDVIVDLTGEFRTDGRLRFQPADPGRVLDVRDGTGGWAPVVGAGQLIDTRVAPSNAEAVTGTITLVRPTRTAFAVADCRDEVSTSNVNAAAGDAMANSLTVAVAAGGLCFRSSAVAKLLFDTTGWWVP